mmetsp:Transcript_28140/g.55258  ORF Transcript_28140/g.55258 Transcript_28140/m.55258 type:complete len:642 (-) Transcript_28140:66-1991(-)
MSFGGSVGLDDGRDFGNDGMRALKLVSGETEDGDVGFAIEGPFSRNKWQWRAAALFAAALLVSGVAALMLGPLSARPRAATELHHPQQKAQSTKPKKEKQCSPSVTNCSKTRCCQVPGDTCYEKDETWSMCRYECVPGPDPMDPSPSPWSCKRLGPRTPGHTPVSMSGLKPQPWVAINCSEDGENCLQSRCCKSAGNACYQKNITWANCKPSCVNGVDVTDTDNLPWSCLRLGGRTPGHAPAPKVASWAKDLCANTTENCVSKSCCMDSGHSCFEKNLTFAQCKPTCTPGIHLQDPDKGNTWTCRELGARTPGPAHPPPRPQKLAPWVKGFCSDRHENCALTRCCKDSTEQCFEKFPGFGQCMYACLPGHKDFSHHKQCANQSKGNESEMCKFDGKTFTCKELGPRTLKPWGYPSLYCVHVMRLFSYEADVVKAQLNTGDWFHGGIFNCDQYAVYSADTKGGTYLGEGPLGPVRTHWFRNAPVWVSKDNTAANTLLFMNFWEAVKFDMQYRCCDWTIKADPDAVVLPQRMRNVLSHKMGWPNFVTTCKGMLYGAVEAISTSGLERYFWNEGPCRALPWQSWGEDVWIQNCLTNMGVAGGFDGGFVSDNLCYGANCGNGFSSAYHPFKDKNSWMGCYWQTTR